jgi:hypothetical protein
MAYQFNRGQEANEGPSIKNLGDIAIKVEHLDRSENSVTGTDMQTGEERTIFMATRDEFADFYVNRNTHTNADARREQAARQLAKQPNVSSFQRNAVEIGDILQFQSVKELADGKTVARWANAVTTNAQKDDAYKRLQIQITIPKDNDSTAGKFERRPARAYDLEQTVPASREALESMTDSVMRRDDGTALEGRIRNSVLIAVSDGVEVKSTSVDLPWDREKNGPATGVDAVFARKLDAYSVETMAALAGRVGYDFDRLELLTGDARNAVRNPEKALQDAREIYNAAAKGQVGVTVTPGWTGELMPHIKQDVMKREERARDNDRIVSLSERGYFVADVAFMSVPEKDRPGGGVYPAQTQFKQVLAAEFLKPASSDEFVRRRVSDIGADAMEIATERDRNSVFSPNPAHSAEVGQAPKPKEPEQAAESELSAGPGY